MDNNPDVGGHKFCEDCFTGFLTSEITRNNVYLECFADNPTTETDAKKSDSVCHQPIIHSDVVKTLKHSENKELLDKYLLFKERKDDPEQRECTYVIYIYNNCTSTIIIRFFPLILCVKM